MKERILLDELEESLCSFMIPLRMMDGFKKKEYDNFCQILIRCRDEWKNRDSIPKRAVLILIDAYSAMESASNLYNSEIKQEIEYAADDMNDLIRQCVE